MIFDFYHLFYGYTGRLYSHQPPLRFTDSLRNHPGTLVGTKLKTRLENYYFGLKCFMYFNQKNLGILSGSQVMQNDLTALVSV